MAGTPAPNAPTAATYSYTHAPRPWKVANKRFPASGGKRNKTLKQILIVERDRVDKLAKSIREQEELAKEGGMEVEGGAKWSEMVTYFSVEAPPSLLPPKKYCDVTGLSAKYTDPKSTLRFVNPEVYEVIKTFQPAVIQAYLAIRGQGVVLR